MPETEKTPQERIQAAEAEEVEAMRDMMVAAARGAKAEAQMLEDLVELNRANINVLMGFTQQGPLESASLPTVIKTLITEVGLEKAKDLLKEGFDYVKDLLTGTSERQKGRSEETKANAAKEAVIKNIKIDVGGDVIAGGDVGGGTEVVNASAT